jgi:predicted transposase/invertase (TIGR01784 family)
MLTQEWNMGKALDTRFMEGREEGISRGVTREKAETARCLLAMGMKLEDIARGTGLSVEKIKSLKPLAPDNAVQIPRL